MSELLYRYYERELGFIRQYAQEFARRYPAAASRLLLEPNRSGDPHIERLIEAFALLAGRVHHKIDDEFPELSNALLGVLYPHYLRPVPSMATVEFVLDAERGKMPDGFKIPRGTYLRTAPIGGTACRFRTAYPVHLWPVKLVGAQLRPPPFPAGLFPPRRTAAALRLQFECQSGMNLSQLSLDKLRMYMAGENHVIAALYEMLFNATTQVVIRPSSEAAKHKPIVMQPGECVSQVGFDHTENVLPYPANSFEGYRLLSEFFAFPNKFHYIDLGGFKRAADAGYEQQFEVYFFFDRTSQVLEEWVDESTFHLGCTPVVNLFETIAEPINIDYSRYEYPIIPDVSQTMGMEIYSIDEVYSTDVATGERTDYQPFYSFRHGKTRDNEQAFWYSSRVTSTVEGDRGTNVYLNLVNRGFDPHLPSEEVLIVKTTCTNRNLPVQLQHVGERLAFGLETAAPVSEINCLRMPTAPLRPPLKRGAYWGLISHLSLNHLSISDPVEGRAALQEILRLYDFSDPEAGQQQLAEVTRQMIEGIAAVSYRRVVGRIRQEQTTNFCRGIEVTLELDEEKYLGTGVFLFSSVIERFLGLYASINSFSQLVAKTTQSEGHFKKWPPRTAELQLL